MLNAFTPEEIALMLYLTKHNYTSHILGCLFSKETYVTLKAKKKL